MKRHLAIIRSLIVWVIALGKNVSPSFLIGALFLKKIGTYTYFKRIVTYNTSICVGSI